jgi:cyclic dehypoxanthinyl futalosine synthase
LQAGIVVNRDSGEFREFLELYQKADLLELGRLADAERWRKHPDPVVTYIVDRNINYTNVCVADCGFCAFARRPRHAEGYVLSYEQIGLKIDECKAQGGVQILLQGGHNPYIPFEWYLELMRYIKHHHAIHIHGFSPSEIVFFAERFGMSVAEVIRELREAGLDSIPGGGGEILVDEVRKRVAPKKAMTDEWLGVQEEAHRQGMKTSVTMMYGMEETDADRLESLFRIREVQSRTGGFTAFICWPLQPEVTPTMSHLHKTTRSLTCARSRWAGSYWTTCRTCNRAGSPWVTRWGRWRCVRANDYGSLMMEDNVVSAAGTTYRTTLKQIEHLITDGRLYAEAPAPGLHGDRRPGRPASVRTRRNDPRRRGLRLPSLRGRSPPHPGRQHIPYNRGLQGYSTPTPRLTRSPTALLGAAGAGDIGTLFPPGEPRWKDADSLYLLHVAVEHIRERGWTPLQADLSIITQEPRIGPYSANMRAALARVLGVDPADVSVKAKSNEGMGFIGRGKGWP